VIELPKGATAEASDYASLHNIGVVQALKGHFPDAEEYFSKALIRKLNAAIAWAAKGVSRAEQAKS